MTCVIDFLNVGFGEATIIRMTGDERSFILVVDSGDVNPRTNSRRCSLEQYVAEQAINRIDALVLTHFHKDHIGGVLAIMGKVPIEKIIVHVTLPQHILQSQWSDHSTPMLASLSLYKDILVNADKLAIPVQLVKEPYVLTEQGASFKLLMPNQAKLQLLLNELNELDLARLAEEQQQKRLKHIDHLLNETAMAVLIRYEGKSAALLTSDVALDFWQPYEQELEEVYVVQAPHHGDVHHISQQWLAKLSPKAVVISADDEGTYQLPHPQFEAKVREFSKADVYYTEAATTTHSIIRVDTNEWRLELIE